MTGVPQGAGSVSSSSAGARREGGTVTRPEVPGVPPGPTEGGDDAGHSGVITDSQGIPVYLSVSVPANNIAAYHTGPLHQEPAMIATVRPERGGRPGCAGHAGALDHLARVVDGSRVGMSMLFDHGNPPACVSSNSAAVYDNITHCVDTPWSSSVRPFQCFSGTGFPLPGLGTL